MKVPFQDLQAQYQTIKADIDGAIGEVIQDSAFVRGNYVSKFEREYSSALGIEHCVSCGNGTDAIYIALRALGIGSGDEVITTALSWIATSETITQTGAKVVFVDVEPKYFTIDPEKIEEKISKKTRAIIPVHLYGQPANMDQIIEIAKRYRLLVIEDCAQAHFAKYNNRYVGTIGDVGTFSFYPGKNLGAYGDAGALVTDSQEVATRARMFANHGALEKNYHLIEGINSRLDGLQGAILSVKLRHIDQWTRERRSKAKLYDELLAEVADIVTPESRLGVEHVYHLYVIRTKNRTGLIEEFRRSDIDYGIHYPTALPFLPAYNYLGHQPNEFPVAYKYQREIISLPLYPELTTEMLEYVFRTVANCYKA